MERKIQEVGNGTYTVSLPKEWAERHNVEAGTRAYLHPHIDGSLVFQVSREDVDPLGDATVDVTGRSPGTVRRAVSACYAAGYDRVRLVGELTDERRRAAGEAATALVGAEVVREDDGEFVVGTMLDPEQVSVRQAVVQLRGVATDAHRTAVDALSADGPARTVDHGRRARRQFVMVRRHFRRSLVHLAAVDALDVTRPRLFEYHAVASRLSRVADGAADATRTAARAPADPEAAALGADVADLLADATTAALDADAEAALDALDTCGALAEEATALAEERRDECEESRAVVDAWARTVDRVESVASVGLAAGVRGA
jgi:phosphate uptake regulator